MSSFTYSHPYSLLPAMMQEETYNHAPLHSLSEQSQIQNRNLSSRSGLESSGSGDSGFSHSFLPPLSANSDHSNDSHGSGSSRRNFIIPLPAIFDIAPPAHSYTGPTTWNNHTSYPSPDIPIDSTSFPFHHQRFSNSILGTTSAAIANSDQRTQGQYHDGTRSAMQYETVEPEKTRNRGQEVSRENWSLADFFDTLGMVEHYSTFVEHGFSHFESMLDIQEEDFDAMSVKRGDRRRIQRSLSTMQGIDHSTPLQLSFRNPPVVKEEPVLEPTSDQLDTTVQVDGEVDELAVSEEGGSQSPPHDEEAPSTKRRKYNRRPRPDPNTPQKPQAAYLRFANLHRNGGGQEGQTFGETARVVGLLWKAMDPVAKAQFEESSKKEKKAYHGLLSIYRRSDTYREYQAYVADFNSKQPTTDDNSRAAGSKERLSSPAKRSRRSKAPADSSELVEPTRKKFIFQDLEWTGDDSPPTHISPLLLHSGAKEGAGGRRNGLDSLSGKSSAGLMESVFASAAARTA